MARRQPTSTPYDLFTGRASQVNVSWFMCRACTNNNNNNTPLDLFRANGTDEEYNNKGKRQCSHKALHGRHPYDLSQQYVDMEASNKWLTSADLFAETDGFFLFFCGARWLMPPDVPQPVWLILLTLL
jgi:hypothetical protein